MQSRFLHRFQAPRGALFSSQLCQPLTTRPFSREQKQTLPKKRISQKPFVNQYTSLKHLAATSAVANVRTQGWAGGLKTTPKGSSRCHHRRQSKIDQKNANVPALPNSGPNRSDRQFLSLSFACASSARLSRAPPARASCLVRVRISSRWLPQQRLLPRLSAFACGNLRCRRRPRDKIAHSGENCILVYNAKAVPPPVSGSSRSRIFVPTLSAADNQAAHEVD